MAKLRAGSAPQPCWSRTSSRAPRACRAEALLAFRRIRASRSDSSTRTARRPVGRMIGNWPYRTIRLTVGGPETQSGRYLAHPQELRHGDRVGPVYPQGGWRLRKNALHAGLIRSYEGASGLTAAKLETCRELVESGGAARW